MQVAGAEMLVAETIRRLGRCLDPVVLCLDGIGRLGAAIEREGVPVVALGRRPGLDCRLVGRLAAELERRRIEVVHAHQYTPFFYAALAKAWLRRPIHLMFTEHGRHYPDVVPRRRRLANRFGLARLADEINGVCRFSASSLARVDGFADRPIEVIENGIDLARYDPPADRAALRRSLALDPARRYIVCVARFHPVKHHEMLLRAFASLVHAWSDVDLLLVGDGPLRGQLEAQADSLGVAARVRFLGVREDVAALLHASDIFALTSLSEAASLTLLEAMACRLPVVVTAVGGNPEIVTDGEQGLLVPRGDAGAAAAAFDTLLRDPARAHRMGEAGRRLVERRFQLQTTLAQYYERYMAAADRLRGESDRRTA